MRKVRINKQTSISTNQSYEGEPLEYTLARITTTNEPIDATSPQTFTERKDGVLPETDIRTDRWDIAMEAMDKVSRAQIAKREGPPKQDTKPSSEPTQATSGEPE